MAEPKDTLAAWVTPTPTGSVPTPPAPQMLAGRYQILGLVGIGGMGSVYRARDRELDEIVALKMLRPDLVAVAGMLDRFRQEVKLARRVTHPNVVRTFDLGEHGEQRFLTMEFVEGTSLARRLEERGRLPAAEAVRIGKAIVEGIAAAHDAGVLHRDLKPDNVLVTDLRVVITDFGIARAAASTRTMGGTVGTPAYMAPEQVQGGFADARTDLYAVGAILFEMLVGRRAWPGDEPFAVALARLQQPPPDPAAFVPVPEPLAALVRRCLARDPSDRFPDARALLAALQSVNAPLPSMNPAPSPAADLPSAHGKAIAVLPLRNAGAAEDNYLAEALSEEIIDALSVSAGLRVRPLGALGAVDRDDPAAAGKRLGVEVVADGSLRRLGGRLRVAVRAINVSDGFQIWAQRFDIAESDALSAGESIARALAAALTVDLRARTPASGADPRAVDLYMRGRAELAEGFASDPRKVASAVKLLAAAADLAPNDPSILAALATAQARMGFYSGTGPFGGQDALEALDHARATAERAVAAGPSRGEGWTALATVRLYTDDVPGCATALKLAVQHSPGLGRAQQLLGDLWLESGRFDQAEPRFRAAFSLEPFGPARGDLARLLAYQGRWTEADALLTDIPAEEGLAVGGAWLARTRLALWRSPPIDVGPRPAHARGSSFLFERGEITRALANGRPVPPEAWEIAKQSLAIHNPRLRSAQGQFMSESLAAGGLREAALDAVRMAVSSGLTDILWMDRCPAIAPLRDSSDWSTLRAAVASRAAKVRAALEA